MATEFHQQFSDPLPANEKVRKITVASDRRGVQFRWPSIYATVKSASVVPSPVVSKFVKPLRELLQQIHELLSQVAFRPLDLPFVLWVPRVGEQGVHPIVYAPSLPFFLELTAVVREDALRLPREFV